MLKMLIKILQRLLCLVGLHNYEHVLTHTYWSDAESDYVHVREYKCVCNAKYETEIHIRYNNIYPKLSQLNKPIKCLLLVFVIFASGCNLEDTKRRQTQEEMYEKLYYDRFVYITVRYGSVAIDTVTNKVYYKPLYCESVIEIPAYEAKQLAEKPIESLGN